MPLTFSITVGIGAAFVSYVVIKVIVGKFAEVHPLLWVVAIAFVDLLHAELDQRRTSSRLVDATDGASTSGSGRRRRSCTIPTMFERTALASGPRVISAQMPGARSVSIAAYVLAGSRLETAAEAGVAHFMEHLTFKGTSAYPIDARHQRGDRGRRWLVQRGDRSRIDRLLGPRPAPRIGAGGRRAGRADRAPDAARRARSRTSGRSSSRRSVRISTTRPSTARSCSRPRSSATGRSVARSAATRPASGPSPRRPSAPSGARRTGPPTRSSPWPATCRMRTPSTSSGRRSGRATASCPGSRPRRSCRPAHGWPSASATRRRRSCAWGSRPCTAITRTAGRSRSSTPCWATA